LYFRTAGWEEEWIETAKEMVHEVFEQSYKQEQACGEDRPTLAMSNTVSKVHAPSSPQNKAISFWQAPSKPKNMFDNLPSLSAPTQKELCDELDQYLSTDPEWWRKS
jgi:hypothetical protein